jgi:hypothetical protein
MANEPPGTSDDQDVLDEVFASANPNPSRAGCPARETLRALGRRERPLDDPAYEHLAACSECYREVRAYQVRRRRARTLGALAATVIGLVVFGWYAVRIMQRQPTRQASVESTSVRITVDLRQYRVARADDVSAPKPPPLELARQRLEVRILLPIGAAPGSYDLQVLDASRRPMASANGLARLEQHTTVLDTVLDLRALAPGRYELALRRHGESWHRYPAQLA